MTIPQPSQHAHDDDAGRPDSGGTQEGGAGSCAETNACASATDLGPISGDSGGDTKHATGSTSQWLTVNVSEDDHSVDGNSLEVKAALVSPAGANFDLFVYVPGDTGGRECSAVTQKSESTTDRDEAGVEFGEDGGDWSNGGGDGRTVTLEVRWVSGPCSPGSTWTLDVTGNQH
jgi:hypothetical protein